MAVFEQTPENEAQMRGYAAWVEHCADGLTTHATRAAFLAGFLTGRDYAYQQADPVREALVAALDEIRRLSLTIVGASEAYGETESAHLWNEMAALAEAALWPRVAPSQEAVPVRATEGGDQATFERGPNHLWSMSLGPSDSVYTRCCELPQGAHAGVTWEMYQAAGERNDDH